MRTAFLRLAPLWPRAATAETFVPTRPCRWACRAASTAADADASGIGERLAAVRAKAEATAVARAGALGLPEPRHARIVAVSKTKPIELLREAYDAGQRHFGENFVQELVEKAPQMPEDVQWHFVGRLQSNKVGTLLKGCPSLACLETMSSVKLARAVDKAWREGGVSGGRQLRVMVQVNTSGEEQKSGVAPAEAADFCRVVATECPGLELAGLMTVGAVDNSRCEEDFRTLHRCRGEAAGLLGLKAEELELSMGMSGDFEVAIREGSTSVRVGSTLFGARNYAAPKAS